MATIDLGKIKQVWRGTYNNGTAYTVDDLVEYTDSGITSTYICVANSTGNAPSSSGTAHASWNYVAKGVADPIPSQSGNSGKVLKTDGSSVSWGTDVGGKILQVVETSSTSNATTSGGTDLVVLTISITPASTSNKILLMACVPFYITNNGNGIGWAKIYRGTNSSGTHIAQAYAGTDNNQTTYGGVNIKGVDSGHNTTSAQSYALVIGRASGSTNTLSTSGWVYSLIAMEIAA